MFTPAAEPEVQIAAAITAAARPRPTLLALAREELRNAGGIVETAIEALDKRLATDAPLRKRLATEAIEIARARQLRGLTSGSEL